MVDLGQKKVDLRSAFFYFYTDLKLFKRKIIQRNYK